MKPNHCPPCNCVSARAPVASDLIARAVNSDMFGEISVFSDIDRAATNGLSFAVEEWADDVGISYADADDAVLAMRPALMRDLTRRCWEKLDRRFIADIAAMTPAERRLDAIYDGHDREKV